MIIRFSPDILIEGGNFIGMDDDVQTYELELGENITDVTNGVSYTIDSCGDIVSV